MTHGWKNLDILVSYNMKQKFWESEFCLHSDEELGDLVNYLLQYDFQLVYRPGSKHGVTGALSRNSVLEHESGDKEVKLIPSLNTLTIEDIP